jgi:hypothetical protein
VAEGIEELAMGVERAAAEVGDSARVGDVEEVIERANVVVNEPEAAVRTAREVADEAFKKAQEEVQAGAQRHRDYTGANGTEKEKSPDLDLNEGGVEQEELIAAQIQSVCPSLLLSFSHQLNHSFS